MSEEVLQTDATLAANALLRRALEVAQADAAALRQALHDYIHGPQPFDQVRKVFAAPSPGAALLTELEAAQGAIAVADTLLQAAELVFLPRLSEEQLWAAKMELFRLMREYRTVRKLKYEGRKASEQ